MPDEDEDGVAGPLAREDGREPIVNAMTRYWFTAIIVE